MGYFNLKKAKYAFTLVFGVVVAVGFMVLAYTSTVSPTDKFIGFCCIAVAVWLVASFSLGKDFSLGYLVTKIDSELYPVLRYVY